MTAGALVLHAHFYQPPRENPWTEEVPREPSAAPYHDWNVRIAAECYRPNAFARVVDEWGRVVRIVNNYEHLSFDVGPTLMSWLETHAADVYERILEADRRGRGAVAQAFFHVILPLAGERDARTLVRWGLAEFEHRFGRQAQGMWLPETAVNDTVLRILAEEGVRFTLLAPGQAATPGIDARHPYRWESWAGDGAGIDIVFYDGPTSHAVAFELPTLSSHRLVDEAARLLGDDAGVVAVAADGETFGHHHPFGERLLAHAFAFAAPERGLEVSTVGAVLEREVAAGRVDVRESAWSCAHGVGRWADDCGCSTGGPPGWNQRWRAPLRAALDVLRDHAAEVFERRGAAVLRDPWEARDAYIEVLLGRASRETFTAEHVIGDPVEAFTLLEAQRHVLAMYTSCAWFFNDLAGLETVQGLRYAARAIDLLVEVGEPSAEDEFLEILAKAESNDAAEGDGRSIWHRHVVPARVEGRRVVAHLALLELLEGRRPEARAGGHDVVLVEHAHATRGALSLSSGIMALTHLRTGRCTELAYAAVHLGGLEVLGAVRPADSGRDQEALDGLRRAFAEGAPVTTLLRLVSDGFGPWEFGLDAALPGAAERILERAATRLSDRFAAAYDRLFADHHDTLAALAAAGYPLPPLLRAPVELALARRLESAVASQLGSTDPSAYGEAALVAQEARVGDFRLEAPQALATLEQLLLRAVEQAVADPSGDDGGREAGVGRALSLLHLARQLGLSPNLDRAQEVVYAALVDATPERSRALGELATALGLAVEAIEAGR